MIEIFILLCFVITGNSVIVFNNIRNDIPVSFIEPLLLQDQIKHFSHIVIIFDKSVPGHEIEELISIISKQQRHDFVIGQLNPNPKEPWTPNEYDSVRKFSGQTEVSTVRNIEMENRDELSMPSFKYTSQLEVIFVLIGRRFSFKPTYHLPPDFPMIDPTPDDPLSYLSERMLQLKIIHHRRKQSYFVFWNKFKTEFSTLLHPMVYGLVFKIEVVSLRRRHVRHSVLILKNHCFSCPVSQIKVNNIYKNKSFNTKNSNLFPNFGKNGNGMEVVVSSKNHKALLQYEVVNGKLFFRSGFQANTIEEICRQLNLKYRIIANIGTGFKHKNGTFGGCVGDVYYGRADIVAAVAPEVTRLQAIDVYTETKFLHVGFVTKLPQVILVWNTVFKPFSIDLWIAIIFTVIALTLFLRLTVAIMRKPRFKNIFTIQKYSGRKVLQFPLFCLLNQLNRNPVVPAIRPIVISWLFFSLIIYVLLGDHLMAVFINPSKEKELNSLQELLEEHLANSHGIGAANNKGVMYLLLSGAKSGIFKKLFNEVEFLQDVNTCFRKVFSEKRYACFEYSETIDLITSTQYIDNDGNRLLHVAKNPIYYVPLGIGGRLGFPFGPQISKLMMYMVQSGLTQHWYEVSQNEWFKRGIQHAKNRTSGNYNSSKNEEIIPISLRHLLGIFIVLGGGLLLSVIASYCEYIFSINTFVSRQNSVQVKYTRWRETNNVTVSDRVEMSPLRKARALMRLLE